MSSSSSSLSSSSSSSLSADYTRGLKLTPYFQRVHVSNEDTVYRMRVVATDAYLMDAEVFRYLRGFQGAEQVDVFNGVCAAWQLSAFPVGDPAPAPAKQFYRLAEVVLDFPSVAASDEAWDKIRKQVTAIVNSLNRADFLEAGEPYVVGNPPLS